MINSSDEILDELVDQIKPMVPEAPNLKEDNSIVINRSINLTDIDNISRLQDYERNLVKLDRLFISRGLRFVLIIPVSYTHLRAHET